MPQKRCVVPAERAIEKWRTKNNTVRVRLEDTFCRCAVVLTRFSDEDRLLETGSDAASGLLDHHSSGSNIHLVDALWATTC